MKKTTFLKSLLLAAALTTGASAWAVTNSTTVTGIVGATDNSSGFDAVGNKSMPLAAGDEYVITFVNYNKGANGTDYWENWAFISNVFACRADYGASNPCWGTATNVSYTGNSWTDISSTITDWLRAYNGVTVTLTVSRDAAGTGISITHSATTNAVDAIASQTYAGTFTATVGAEEAINFYLTVEDAHLNITNVVYTNASNEVTHYDLVDVDLSKFDANYTYSDGVASFKLGSGKWSKLDFSSYYSSITGTITNINLKFTENIGTGGRMCFGIFGNNKSAWNNGMPETANSVSTWGVCGSSNANRVYFNGGNVNTLNTGSAAAIELNMDIINKKFTFIQAGTTLVDDKSFYDTDITSPQYFAGHTWTTESNTTTLTDMTMEIVYLETTYYTATFTNTTSGNTVSATIYTDSERTSEITNGLLEDGKTYYFTASETGYQDYNGTFTVSSSDPLVSFAMTAKSVYNYTVNAVDAEDGIIKSAIVSGTCYADESTSFYLPTCVLVDGTLYFMTAESSYKSETVTDNDQVFSYPYTESTVDNVVFFVEGESIDGATTSTPTNLQNLASNGYMGRGSNLSVTTLPAGAYTIYVKYINANSSSQNFVVKAGDTEVINETVTGRPTKSGTVTLTEETAITLTAAASSISGVDYLYIVQTGVSATITDAGWATLYTDKALDFSGVEGLTAYTATCENSTVTLTEVQNVPANTGVVLKGAANTYNIPVIASSTTDKGHLLGSTTDATAYNAYDGYTLYMLNIVNGKAQFVPVTSDEIAAGKAFLKISSGNSSLVRSLNVVFGEDATGINAVNAQQATKEYYNLRGQRVAAPQKGLYIVNGKKVVVK